MDNKTFNTDALARGFETVSVRRIDSLKADAVQLRHTASGARILHISCPDRENCFCVAVPTPPPDDTGMPHILEHLTLAGSQKFPCKEPFFEMIKRSVATFINALTGNDITYYPVCSTVKADLINLADVYFDAVFHPILSEETFMREAYHLAPVDPAKPLGDLRYDGIVYSEMKGVFSSPEGILERDAVRRLLPDTCHGKESGGNPEAIPDLTLEALRRFHAARYNPRNAFIVLYGDIPTADWLAFLAPRLDALAARPGATASADASGEAAKRQPKWESPRSFAAHYPLPADEDTAEKTYLMLNWLLGDSTDLAFSARVSILSFLLAGTDAAPLKKAINDSHLGANVAWAGASPNGLELTYHLALEGSEPDRLEAYRKVVLDTLSEVASKPFDRDDIAAAFQQTVYACNEIGSNYAFTNATNAATAWCAGLDPASLLDRAPYFERARREIEDDPWLLPGLVRTLFLDNTHRLDIVLSPSATMEAEQDAALAARLAEVRKELSDGECERIAEAAAALEAMNSRPNTPDDLKCLPSLKVSDISPKPQVVPATREETGAGGFFVAADGMPTNGIVYLAAAFDLRGLPSRLWNYIARFEGAVSDFGTKGLDYAEATRRRTRCTGVLACNLSSQLSFDGQTFRPSLVFTMKTTESSLDDALEVFRQALFELDPRDPARMADLIVQDRAVLRADFVQDARATTRIHSARRLSRQSHVEDVVRGLPQLALLERLGAAAPEVSYGESAESIEAIRDFILDPARASFSFAGPDGARDKTRAAVDKWLSAMRPAGVPAAWTEDFTPDFAPFREGLSAALQVSFSALSAPAPHASSPESLALSVGSSIVSTDYMLPEVRLKGNAYGAGVGYTAATSTLVFSSYRDPHVAETLETMLKAKAFVTSSVWSKEKVDNAILTIVKRFEAPIRPAAAVTRLLTHNLIGITDEWLAERYAKLLALKPQEVQETTLRLLEEAMPRASYCVAASEAMLAEAARRIPGLTISPIIAAPHHP